MNCLCCNKPLKNKTEEGWHKSCVKRFFNTTELPEIDIDEQALKSLATESISQGFTVPGVQKKLSLHLHSESGTPRLTLMNYPTGYILKPQVEQYRAMPEAEHVVMTMAESCGISTVPHALIKGTSGYAYITRRVDRNINEEKVEMLAMEDFCQLDLRLTQDKYKGSYERCAKIVQRYSCQTGLDLSELFMRLVFSFVTGNSDMHLKNFSLIETAERSEEYKLSPAYDLLPVNIILPEDNEQFALTMNGKKTNIRKKDFLQFAEACGISRASADKMINKIISSKQKLLKICSESLLPHDMKESFCMLIEKRVSVLE